MLASVDSESHSGDALPVCLAGENSNRLVTGGHARTLTYVFEEPLDAPKGPLMEFRLIYEGPLPSGANNPHPKTKHSIRKAIHPQLKELWNQHEFLRKNVDYFANNWQACGFRWVPLITEEATERCSIDLLLLSRDHQSLLRNRGDIDNRVKVLFDGLRMAQNMNELAGAKPEEGEDPFFCLSQDDKLITKVTVTTDRLLAPVKDSQSINDVFLVIHVNANIAGVDSDGGFVTINGKIVSY